MKILQIIFSSHGRMGWIYLIKNKVNGKCYVGQTIKKRVEQRWSEHRRHPQGCLKYAFARYGPENFEFSTICEIPEGDGWRESLDAREIFEIMERNTLVPSGYNIETGGNTNKIVHPETRKKISEANTGQKRTIETCIKISENTRGLKRSDETRQRIRESRIGTKATAESKSKMSIARSGVNNSNLKSVEQWSKDGETLIEVHHSLKSAAIKVGLKTASKISECCHGGRKSAGGFYWKLRE
jgi:group I intron endonuclease